MRPVSRRTYRRIEELSRETQVDGVRLRYCPCRILPETVLSLKAVMHEMHRLWADTLGAPVMQSLLDGGEGGRFFAGEARLVEVQAGRPEMVAVWLPFPPDYPDRLKVQLVDVVEPCEHPGEDGIRN